jgi:uncharacterized membrane protein
MSGLKIIGVIIFTMIIFTAIMASLSNTDSEYTITDNNESESTGLFNVPTGMFRGLENSISFEELGTTGTIIKGGIILFLGFILLFWLRGTT